MLTSGHCSIILPFFNSEKFIASALDAIVKQTQTNFELIAIDDGSSDESLAILKKITADWKQPVTIITQKNQGSYAARNNGLDQATGEFITFYDVDDLWSPKHLEECLYYLETYPEVDLIYTNCQMIDLNQSGKIVQESAFHQNSGKNKFLDLAVVSKENLKIITDPRAVQFQILYGLYLGLQFTVFRSHIFSDFRFTSINRNEAEDQLTTIKLIKAGRKIGYLENIHGTYHIHQSNSSAANIFASRERKIQIRRALITGYAELREILNLREKIALNQRLSKEYFWNMGYNLGLQFQDYSFTLKNYLKGIYYWPFDLRYYKSFIKLLLLIIRNKK